MYMLLFTVLLVPYVTAHSEVIDKAREICEASCRVSYPGFRLIHCHEGVCLMKQEMYNWREMPLPIEDRQGSHGFPQQEKGDARPVCCKFSGSDNTVKSVNKEYLKKCEDYETFTRNITKRAVRVGMDISVMKIQSVGQRTISVVFWLDLSFIDNRLRICNCQSNEDNMRKNHFMLIGAHTAEKWFLPDTAILDLQMIRDYHSLTMTPKKLKALPNGGDTLMVYGSQFEVQIRCKMVRGFPESVNRCLFRFGSHTYNESYVEYYLRSLRAYPVSVGQMAHDPGREPITSHEIVKLHQKDRVVRKIRPKNETFIYDGFEIVSRSLFPADDEVGILNALFSIGAIVAIFIFSSQGFVGASQERTGYATSLATFTVIVVHGLPSGEFDLMHMHGLYWAWVKEAVDLILAGIISLFVVLRMRGDGSITETEQFWVQLAVGLFLLVWNLNECRVKMNYIVNSWHPEGCNNFLKDTYYI